MSVVNDLKSRIERIANDYGYYGLIINDENITLEDDYNEIYIEKNDEGREEVWTFEKHYCDVVEFIRVPLNGYDIEMCHKLLEVLKDEE